MTLKLTVHVQARVAERELHVDHIKAAIKNPDSSKSQEEGRIRVEKKVNGKTIVVIYCKEGFRDKKDEYLIITAYYLGK